jgi:hypothetical protein
MESRDRSSEFPSGVKVFGTQRLKKREEGNVSESSEQFKESDNS